MIPPTPLYIIYMIYTYMYIRIRNNLCLRHRNRQMSLGSDLFTFIMGTTLINFTSLVWMFVWACFPTFVISWYAQWSFDHCLHHHLSKITSFFKQWPTWRWLDFVTTFQNNLAVTKQQIVKKYFHQSWNINCPILFNTISFYTEMISISLFLGFHIELNILGTRDISCVLHEIQIWNLSCLL